MILTREKPERGYLISLGENWKLNTGQEMGFAAFSSRLFLLDFIFSCSRKITNGQVEQVLYD